AKAGGESDVDDAAMRKTGIGKHCVCAVEPALRDVLGERLPGPFEQALDTSPGYAEPVRDVVDIQGRITAVPLDLGQHRAQPRRPQPAPRNDLPGLGAGSDNCGYEVEKMQSDRLRYFGRRRHIEGEERRQVAVKKMQDRSGVYDIKHPIFR